MGLRHISNPISARMERAPGRNVPEVTYASFLPGLKRLIPCECVSHPVASRASIAVASINNARDGNKYSRRGNNDGRSQVSGSITWRLGRYQGSRVPGFACTGFLPVRQRLIPCECITYSVQENARKLRNSTTPKPGREYRKTRVEGERSKTPFADPRRLEEPRLPISQPFRNQSGERRVERY